MREEIEKWLKKAESDFKKAKDNLNIGNYDLASFLSQQAIEKALKALQIKKENNFSKTHDILFLAKKLNLPSRLIGYCDKLNPVYIESRYPDVNWDFESYNKEESSKDIKMAKEVLSWIKKNL